MLSLRRKSSQRIHVSRFKRRTTLSHRVIASEAKQSSLFIPLSWIASSPRWGSSQRQRLGDPDNYLISLANGQILPSGHKPNLNHTGAIVQACRL
jgi:hypothetical protein